MKFVLAAIVALCAFPASAKMWVDVECSRVLVTADDRWLFEDNGKQLVTCRIESWPVSTPIAKMACDSGQATKMEMISDHTLIWNDVEMNAYTGPLPCGANGAEWPD